MRILLQISVVLLYLLLYIFTNTLYFSSVDTDLLLKFSDMNMSSESEVNSFVELLCFELFIRIFQQNNVNDKEYFL